VRAALGGCLLLALERLGPGAAAPVSAGVARHLCELVRRDTKNEAKKPALKALNLLLEWAPPEAAGGGRGGRGGGGGGNGGDETAQEVATVVVEALTMRGGSWMAKPSDELRGLLLSIAARLYFGHGRTLAREGSRCAAAAAAAPAHPSLPAPAALPNRPVSLSPARL